MLNSLAKDAHAIALSKGWYGPDGRGIPELIALVHSELSEALECYRDGMPVQAIEVIDGKPEGFAVELADTIIRIADMAGYLGLDLDRATALKMAYNRTRPVRHGGKKA